MSNQKAFCILTVIGKDQVGIVWRISEFLARNHINIEDISQRIMADNFVMAMMVDISRASLDMETIQKELEEIGKTMGLKIQFQNTDIFKSMHRI